MNLAFEVLLPDWNTAKLFQRREIWCTIQETLIDQKMPRLKEFYNYDLVNILYTSSANVLNAT